MTKLDITTLTHAAEIFEPDMTVEHPVYYVNANGTSVTLDGYKRIQKVSGFYQSLTDSGTNVIVLQDEQLAVADWGLATEATFNSYARGGVVRRTSSPPAEARERLDPLIRPLPA